MAYRLRTDFRAGIAYGIKAMSGSLTDRELLDIWFIGEPPSDFSAAKEAVRDFYACGRAAAGEDRTEHTPVYSFTEDARALIAAFQREYHIDLTSAELHWWRFYALLEGLLTHTFSERVQYRSCNPDQIKSREMRARYQKYKEEYSLDRRGRKVKRPKTLEEYNEMLLRQARGED